MLWRRADDHAVVFGLDELSVYYGDFRAVRGVTIDVHEHEITAFIGPSGCGKTTVLRSLNRMNDFIETARVEGKVLYHGVDLYDSAVNATEVRRRIGMVFQKPNPFPKSIYDNVAYGPRLSGVKKRAELDEVVERSLRGAALWDEVKDRLKSSGLSLSGGQQQRLCIARAVAVEPDVILMDEPCSALDPIATARIEELMQEIKSQYTIVIVTHNMQQAARVSDRTAFFTTRGQPRERSAHRPVDRVQPDPEDLLESRRRADRAVRDGTVRMTNDLRQNFHHELDEIRQAVARLAASVTELVPRVTEILLAQDLEGAEYVILGDDEIDSRSIEIEERCLSVLALQAPVASDLRQIVSALKLAPEIERSADLCVNICKAARRIYGHDLDPKLRGVIQKMGEQAQMLFKEATEAYLANDGVRAAALDDMDSYLDDLQREFVQQIFESHAAGTIDLQVAVQLAVVARFYERIGDHAVNIGEKVQYVASGWMPERRRGTFAVDEPAVEVDPEPARMLELILVRRRRDRIDLDRLRPRRDAHTTGDA